ncbi:superoxide dismutase [Candidatus Woesearchaeota archaeon]|nr:superoxide dismutase [Candidatus Woesearchaeota archaeon]MCF7901053.1 superoxide dismutase [Candidatus Woesearchaeota archaeon]MCF8013950.1 superoxide dismutase [Candidatus Woesearchaeota archaeon]
MTHELPELGYEYDALEPFIDAKTMEIHHSKHHAGYVAKLNAALENAPEEFKSISISELIKKISKLPESVQTAIRNNGGGHFNHSIFWDLLKKDVPFEGELAKAIKAKWGDFDKFKEEFSNVASTRFGSGWAWLVLNMDGHLAIMSTANQDNPLSEGKKPILGLDVWEHAYYLKYQNKRPEYIDAFFNVINWKQADHNFKTAKSE